GRGAEAAEDAGQALACRNGDHGRPARGRLLLRLGRRREQARVLLLEVIDLDLVQAAGSGAEAEGGAGVERVDVDPHGGLIAYHQQGLSDLGEAGAEAVRREPLTADEELSAVAPQPAGLMDALRAGLVEPCGVDTAQGAVAAAQGRPLE